MAYTLKWAPKAYKHLEDLPKDVIHRILGKLDTVTEDPFRYIEHFEGENLFKLRIGDYRALVEMDFNKKIILIQVFGHRSRVYNK